MQKLILIDGGPASGKSTLGALLVHGFRKPNNKFVLLDLDVCVEKINPSWIWEDKQTEKTDQQKARENFAQDIDKCMQRGFSVIAIGERFLTKEDIVNFIKRLRVTYSAYYLYHLNPPFELRKQRLEQRGPSLLIDLEKDQRERDSNAKWYGYVYENINSPIEDAKNIMGLIQNDEGILDTAFFSEWEG
jgi:shikimate kinase